LKPATYRSDEGGGRVGAPAPWAGIGQPFNLLRWFAVASLLALLLLAEVQLSFVIADGEGAPT
jgi:hypothetical protein